MGIHPSGEPLDGGWVPATIDEAAEFYRSYCRRQWAGPLENPDGVKLSRANLEMVQGLIPWWGKLIGLGMLPRLVMTELLGVEGMARVGLRPLPGHRLLRGLVGLVLRLTQRLADDTPGHLGERLGRLVFDGMIRAGRGGEVTFLIPADLADLRSLA
jgi:hypothetical protein